MSKYDHEESFSQWADSQQSSGKAETPPTDVNTVGAQGQEAVPTCPFCGKAPTIIEWPIEPHHVSHNRYVCQTHGCAMFNIYASYDQWSKRAAPSVGSVVSSTAAGASLECKADGPSSRICELGTKGCEVEHATPSPIQPEASEEEIAREFAKELFCQRERIRLFGQYNDQLVEWLFLAAIRKAKSAPVGQVHEGQQ